MPVTIDRYIHTSIKNLIGGKIVNCPNGNNLAKIPVLSRNNASMMKRFVRPNNFIYLVKTLIICFTLLLINYFKYTCIIFPLSFICDNVRSEPNKKIEHGISSHVSCLLDIFY